MNTVQLIHIAKNKAGLDDETYRDKLATITGKTSTKEMTEAQREMVLQVFINEGFATTSGSKNGRSRANTLSGRFAQPIRAFWLSGWNLGVIREKDDRAILAFARRQTGLEHVQFAVSDKDGQAIIEAIKALVRRDADLPDLWRPIKGYARQNPIQDARVQVVFAQWTMLARLGEAPCEKLVDWEGFPGRPAIDALDGPALIDLQKALGRMIRNAQAKRR